MEGSDDVHVVRRPLRVAPDASRSVAESDLVPPTTTSEESGVT
jgi:hypothetical protein